MTEWVDHWRYTGLRKREYERKRKKRRNEEWGKGRQLRQGKKQEEKARKKGISVICLLIDWFQTIAFMWYKSVL